MHDKGTPTSTNKHSSTTTTVHGRYCACVRARGFLEVIRIEMRFGLVLMRSTFDHVDGSDWAIRGVYGSGLIVFEKWGALESLSNGESIVFENTCQHVFLCRTC